MLALSTNQSINQPIMFIMFWGRHGRDRMGVTAYGIYASILDADGMYWLQLYVLSLSVSVAGWWYLSYLWQVDGGLKTW
jgi:hypothetical protein